METKILIISSTPFFGGGEQFLVTTLSRLKEYYSIHYVVNSKEVKERLKCEDVTMFKSSNYIGKIIELKRIVSHGNYDVLIFNGSNICYSLPLFHSHKAIYYRHTTNECVPIGKRWIFELIQSLIYKYASVTIHVSKFSQREQKNGNSAVVHNGIDINENSISSTSTRKPLNILFCGRLEEAKGIKTIVNAFNRIDAKKAVLTIIGNGTATEWVKEHISQSIIYNGFQTNVEPFYRNSNALILMSRFENFPISIIEAQKYGLPVITTGVGGISEMIKDNYNGIIIPETEEAIIEAVNKLADRDELLTQLSRNASAYCRNELNLNDKINEILNIIEDII